jgi:hypothetical protein
VSDDFNFKIPVKYMNLMDNVQFDEYTIEINILGLRDLQSNGILPVKKAFIQFNLKSLVLLITLKSLRISRPNQAQLDPTTINTMI